MKRKSIIITAISTMLLTSITILSATPMYNLIVNNQKVDAQVIVKDGVTYVPLRVVGEKLDADVSFENGTITVTSKSTQHIQGATAKKEEVQEEKVVEIVPEKTETKITVDMLIPIVENEAKKKAKDEYAKIVSYDEIVRVDNMTYTTPFVLSMAMDQYKSRFNAVILIRNEKDFLDYVNNGYKTEKGREPGFEYWCTTNTRLN